MIDWEKAKTEYLTENTSYRQLAEKYHVSQRTVERHSAEGKWNELRRQRSLEMQQRIFQAADEKALRRAQRILSVADQMVDRVAQALSESETLSGTELRSLAGTLKSIKEIQMIQSPLDEQEQRIKIANLEKQAQKQEECSITVVLEGELEEYAK